LVLNEDILLISSFGLGFLYSISKEGPISPLFSKNACFIGLAGEAKRAIIEIPIPNCYEWEREIEKPKNYLYAVINENGKYISPVYNYNTGEVYPINTTPTDSLGISYNRMMSAIIKDAEASSDIFIGSNSSKQNFTKHLQPYMHRK
jgi:hypothetical protein